MSGEFRDHIIWLLKDNLRIDGRKALDYRQPLKVEYGVVKSACGSAKVTLGETEVIVGVKFELGTPYPDTPDEGTIQVGAELYPLSNPEFELGPPGIFAIELARVVDRGIRESKSIDFKKLCMTKGEKVWMAVIDIAPLNDAGNLMDISALAALAALKTAYFPQIKDDKVDYKSKRTKKLQLECEPIEVTVLKVGDQFFVDPTTEEEKIADARLTVASLADGTLCALQKGGEYPLDTADIERMIDIALEKAKELRGAL